MQQSLAATLYLNPVVVLEVEGNRLESFGQFHCGALTAREQGVESETKRDTMTLQFYCDVLTVMKQKAKSVIRFYQFNPLADN